MTWLFVLIFAVAGFFLGRAWQGARDEARIDFYIDEIEAGVDLITKQQRLIREQRDYIDAVNREWQADRDRLTQRGTK